MFKSQFLLMIRRHEFQISFLFTVAVSLIYPVSLVYSHLMQEKDIGTLIAPQYAFIFNRYSGIWFNIYYFFPLILMFPFAYSYATDKKTHYDSILISRSGIKKYLYSKAFCCLIGGFIITFIPGILNMTVSYIFLPQTFHGEFGNTITDDIISFINDTYYEKKSHDAYLWLVHPKICFIFSSFRVGVLGAVFSLVIYVISLMMKNLKFFYFSVLPVLIFFVMSHRIQESLNDMFCIDLLEYAFAGSYITFYPCVFWLSCVLLTMISFFIITIHSKKDQLQ